MKNLFKTMKKSAKASGRLIAWKLLKGIIFIVCLTFFFFQSAQFLLVYYKYPTATKIEFTYPDEFEFPAVTFCNINPVKRSKFCAEYANLCETIKNNKSIKFICEEVNPFFCKDNSSYLVIPKFDKSSKKDIQREINKIYFKGNTSKEFWEEWVWSIKTKSEMKPVFVWSPEMYYPCFSENLLINSTNEPQKMTLNKRQIGKREIRKYYLYVQRSEEVRLRRESHVFFAIHSPFVPVNLIAEGNRLKPGYKYNAYIRLAEEKLLPFPYGTDCTKYEDLWTKNNHTGPRSQEMCKSLCVQKFYEKRRNYTLFLEMLEYPLELYLGGESGKKWVYKDKRVLRNCLKKCKRSCRNLKYSTTINEASRDFLVLTETDKSDIDLQKNIIQVEIFLGDRHVVVEEHFALYNTGYLFSYIGGLMGCWLGVSIWAFAGIAENVFRRAYQWMGRIKRCLKESFPTRQKFFSTRRVNVLFIRNS